MIAYDLLYCTPLIMAVLSFAVVVSEDIVSDDPKGLISTFNYQQAREDQMREAEKELLKELVTHIGKNQNAIPQEPLTGFLAMRGNLFNNELMIVGRAVNGWGKGWLPSEVNDPAIAERVVNDTYRSVARPQKCPMLWVSNAWGRTDDYNTKRSAFWRVTREVVGGLGITDVGSDEWPSYLVWSNLYKISPEEGGNPSASLSDLQLNISRKLLELEVSNFSPRKVLFLTGFDWVFPFLNGWSSSVCKTPHCKLVKATGNLELSSGEPCNFVVASHPQGKNESVWVKEVVSAFLQ